MQPSQDPEVSELLEKLASAQHDLNQAREDLAGSQESATADDRLLTVTVGPNGQLVDLTFHTRRYREMAPAELSAAIIATVERARGKWADRVTDTFAPYTGGPIRRVMRGEMDVSQYLASLSADLSGDADPAGGQ